MSGATEPRSSSDFDPEIVLDEAEESSSTQELNLDEAPAEPGPLARGADIVKSFWRHAPHGPGVYRMIGADGEVLYVGKARSIKKRILSYTTPERQSMRIARMVSQTVSMVFVTTESETEALLLEANLIKQLRPRYNVLLRDDKSFPYILIATAHEAPQLIKHRGSRSIKGDYFGPFASATAVFRTINALQRAFLLRTCSDSFYENRTRPCLQFQIKRCSAPCTGEIAIPDYNRLVDEARDFLAGRSRAIRHRLADEMTEAAEALEFEKAARLRDRIAALSAVQGEQSVNPRSVPEADVFAICEEAGQFCVEAFFFRTYQNWGNRAYFPRADRNLSASEVLDSFLAQFYVDRPAPRLILLSHEVASADMLRDILSARMGKRVAIGAPKRGEKKELVDNAIRNAREALSRRLAEASSQGRLLASLGQVFGMETPPRRVEVYDNSHIMGTNAIGAMIVAGPEGFVKGQYRTFNIKNTALTPGDDYGDDARGADSPLCKAEARRGGAEARGGISRQVPISSSSTAARASSRRRGKSWSSLGVEGVTLAGIAKGEDRNAGRETFFVVGKPSFKLPPRDPALFFVQRLRDEAHRFAIGTHRAKRKREFVKSPLDEIPGIGPARKRALLHAFGTAKEVGKAGLADLEKTPGLNAATARLVYNYFHEGR